ncbi:MAG: ATP-binding cassette domain-containing protein [Bdellovibrionota bacterium]
MIQVSHLTKMYGPRAAIDDLNFEVQKGEIVGFLGPNGAGKTTTMKILAGCLSATQGTAMVAGHDVFIKPIEVKKHVGFLPENLPLYLEMRVQDFLEFVAKLHGVPKSHTKSAVDSSIEKTALKDVRKRIIGNLSKGYKQRVGLAQALVHNPDVLILDEPTVGLDPKQIIEIRELIKGLAGEHTVILSSHILPEVTATCSRIMVINKGRIVAEDTLDRLTARLKKGLVYTMLVKSPSSTGVDAIRRIQGVSAVTASGDRLVVEMLPNTGEIRDKLVETAVSSRMGVLEFAAERISLEEIFLQLTTTESPEGVTA